ncbi:hypothetical protein BH11ACT8_BH11ACT8_00530 [soil metagenome]
MIGKALRRFEKLPSARIGVLFIVVLFLVGGALFQKSRISDTIRPGDEVKVSFARDYQMRAHVTKVKVAGVPIGVVTGIEHEKDGTAVATLKIDKGEKEKLGLEPSAAIRPTTLLGGNYYVELAPGGDPGSADSIPPERTSTPIEFDRVLETLKPETRASTQRSVARLDATMREPGRRAFRGLVKNAPDTLTPLAPVLASLKGERPGENDLGRLVSSLESTARALSADPGALDGVLVALASTSSALADTSPQVARTIADLPRTLENTRTGLGALGHTLDELRDVSDDARPTARALSTTLQALDPALKELRPVLSGLRPALRDLRPMVDDLVPSAVDGTAVLGDVNGDALDRVKGPVVDTLNSSWHGTGAYANGGNDSTFYHELGDLIAGMNNAGRMTDRNGSTIHFQPGFGVGSLSGTPLSFEQLLMQLAYPGGAP